MRELPTTSRSGRGELPLVGFPVDCQGTSEGGTGFKRRWCVGWASLGLLPTENRPADSAGAHSRRNFSIVCTRQMLISHRRDAEMVLIYINEGIAL
jgi:hypothetical protein